MSIEAQHISKTYGAFRALNDVSLRVETGELVALLGPSGSGKTTLLRVIAGLEQPDPAVSGPILFGGENVGDRPVAERHVGFVFQHYALFRHMTVLDNVTFGLRARPRATRPSRTEMRDRGLELLRLVQLEGLAKRFPAQLSGGQRQRVALARALAVQPKVLLLDEPFGALDAKVRRELRRWLRRLHEELHVTTVFVTHDQEEALEVADRVAILNRGRIEQVGTPEEVYDEPATPFVYDFLGNVNLFQGRLSGGEVEIGGAKVRVNGGPSVSSSTGDGPVEEKPAVAYVRPYDVEVSREPGPGGNAIEATVVHVSFAGPFVNVQLSRTDNDETVEASVSRDRHRVLALKHADRVYIKLRNPRVFSDDYSI